MNLLERMKVSIDTMTMGEKFLGSMIVTLVGIGIVFAGLAILYFAIIIMQKVVGKSQPKKIVDSKPSPTIEDEVVEEETVDSTELVAVITAAVAASLNTSTHNIIVRNITRISDQTPSWAKIGRVDQISNKL
ncbi:OadG family protein [Alkaliphilus sp. MSJ-5]|uniref:OadG family protein n=1 Tax=Alkaliphilus flagellatus TaxID=2841507 RepID=A0ABS6G1M5_9FIRM|nr:OadG family protein [Alkaliphilus flagellatus]MBU5676274.1 OadG family protein [Alkaliphilus flagellatus]